MTTKTKAFKLFSSLDCSLIHEYMAALDCSISLAISIMVKYGDYEQACSVDLNPLHYNDSETFGKNYLAACFLSKWRESSPAHANERKLSSLEKFWSCEDHLRAMWPVFNSCVFGVNSPDVSRVLYAAREKIAQILGPVSHSFSIDACNFGPGASTSVPGHKAHPSKKFLSSDVTSGCRPFVDWFFTDCNRPVPELKLRETSRIAVVPKNFRSDRIIAIEPDWNIFFQKGFGSAIRSRLRRFGLNLDDAACHHGILARQGSVSSDLVTVDLSSASDSIATFLVRFLLPPDWFAALNSVRTDRVLIGDKEHPLVKFSSMGNGFTFELESLIFYGICLSLKETSEDIVSVFGDDIILPSRHFDLLSKTLSIAGFRINRKKSHTLGYFRESCGYHFFKGVDVKPIFLRNHIQNDFEKFKFCNSLRRASLRFYGDRIDHTPLLRVYLACKRTIRRVYYIPEGYGDGGLVSNFDECCPATKRRKDSDIRRYPNCIEGYKVRCLLPVTSSLSSEDEGMLLHKLRYYTLLRFSELEYSIFGSGSQVLPEIGNQFSVRPRVVKFRTGFMHVPKWVDSEVF